MMDDQNLSKTKFFEYFEKQEFYFQVDKLGLSTFELFMSTLLEI